MSKIQSQQGQAHGIGVHKMSQSKVSVGDWIIVGDANINAYVFNVRSDTEVAAGYYQNGAKAIKEDFFWDGNRWQFKSEGPCGSYLKGHEAAIVINGPCRN
ncbi:MAG TPA: hypothetical protein DIW64_10800 [Cellvibrio sp.]|nr:hypothetical protein [Cellvibrio sp.]